MNKELFDVLRVIRSENIGNKTFWSLYNKFGNISDCLDFLLQHTQYKFNIADEKEIEQEILLTEKCGGKIISFFDKEFPYLLKNINDCPPVISVKGNTSLLNKPGVAVVGSRNCSLNAVSFAYKIGQDLGKKNIITVSGLARGIDTSVHKASLDTGTIAVIAAGIDNIYPAENKILYEQIYEKGIVITEMPFGCDPLAQNFPRRNRLISGLSHALIVVEATINSGSLITAEFALEQGRDVYAVPSFPSEARSRGTIKLLKQGAHIFENIDDLELHFLSDSVKHNVRINSEPKIENFSGCCNEDIEQMLSSVPIDLDELIEFTSLDASEVIRIITKMEIEGRVKRVDGNKFCMIDK